MYMPEQVRHSRRSRLVADLAESIRAGRLEHGERLPGENQLAARYEVSRGTVRSVVNESADDARLLVVIATPSDAARGAA